MKGATPDPGPIITMGTVGSEGNRKVLLRRGAMYI